MSAARSRRSDAARLLLASCALIVISACVPAQLDPLEIPMVTPEDYSGEDVNKVRDFNAARQVCEKKANRIASEHQRLSRRIWVGWFVPALVGLVGSVATASTATLASRGVIEGERARNAAIGTSIGVATASAVGIFVRSAIQLPERKLEQQRNRYFEIGTALDRSSESFTELEQPLRRGNGDAAMSLATETNDLRRVCSGTSRASR